MRTALWDVSDGPGPKGTSFVVGMAADLASSPLCLADALVCSPQPSLRQAAILAGTVLRRFPGSTLVCVPDHEGNVVIEVRDGQRVVRSAVRSPRKCAAAAFVWLAAGRPLASLTANRSMRLCWTPRDHSPAIRLSMDSIRDRTASASGLPNST